MAKAAEDATQGGHFSAAMAAWREALDLLPAESKQYQIIAEKITQLGQQMPALQAKPSGQTQPTSASARIAAGVGALGLMAWKLKSLALGLAKSSTLLSMLLSFGVYWTAWGWQFALGLVVSIYVHEMGHVIALAHYGFKATAPMFVPGLGALIRLQQHVVNPREDADIGLAGPIYGLGAAVVCALLWWTTRAEVLAAIAGVGAWINLFNLLPIATLDGGRGFHAFSRQQKLLAAIVAAAAWYFTDDGMIMLLAIVCLYRAAFDKPAPHSYWKAAIVYCLLIAALTAVSMVRHQVTVPN